MRPVSGDDLVTAALQSSLARAQKNYKLSNCKQLGNKSPGRFVRGCSLTGGGDCGVAENTVLAAVKKSKALKFQSEFDLWIEQAQEFSFTSEGYTNGAAVPEDIECLNSSKKLAGGPSGGSTKVKSQNSLLQLKDRLLQKKKKGTVVKVEKENLISPCSSSKENKVATTEKKVTITNGEGNSATVLKGKNKLRPGGGEEAKTNGNSFEIITKFNESRKLSKKLVKIRNRLLKEGFSKEEAQKLIEKAESFGGGTGAIIQKLRQLILNGKKKETALLIAGERKKLKMKDLSSGENGESTVSRPETPVASTSAGSSAVSPRMMNGGCSSSNSPNSGHQLPQPKRVLYPREKIVPGYTEKLPVGAGFYNMGNSCYLNASLQAVFHIPAFINWLRHDVEHRKQCQDSPNCIVCAMKKTFDAAISRGNSPNAAIKPVEIINRLRSICRHFSHGRQEDAHEFLRYLFESMERSYLTAIGCLRIDNRSKETNPLGQIFGGYVRTEVTCLKCHYVSTTFQPTAELQLDIRHVTTLEDAIMNHFKKERLDNNDYKCEKCKTVSQATKQFSLELPPIVLCLQLKRFTLYGTKIAKRIHCNRILDMSKYMHKSKQVNGFANLRYRLVALVTHLGSSPNCGHYTAIAETSNGQFYQFDDSFVHPVSEPNALNNDAYVIIYEMDKRSKKSPEASSSQGSSNSSGYVSNLSYPSSTVTSSQSSSSSSSSPMTSIFQTKKLQPSGPIPKLSSASSSSSTCSTLPSSKLVHSLKPEPSESKISTNGSSALESSSSPVKAGFKGPGLERKMISFGIRPSNTGPKKITILKPGASLTNSSKLSQSSTSSSSSSNGTSNGSSSQNSGETSSSWSSSGSSRSENNHKSDQTIKLVPYNDDDESDKDENVRNGTETSSSENSKRLKSPNILRKQSPGKIETPVTPPKSPKPTSSSSTATTSPREFKSSPVSSQENSSSFKKDRTPPSSQTTETTSVSSNSSKVSENSSNVAAQRDGVKRKAPSDEETTPRKSRSHRKRHSSSSSSSSSSTRSTSSTSESRHSTNTKRKRDEEVTPTKSPIDKKPTSLPYHHQSTSSSSDHNGSNARRDRESQSQERDRERRRDRNRSRSRSPSMDTRDKRGSSIDRRRDQVNGGTFDVSKLRMENTIVGWDGQKSLLSKSMEEDRKRMNAKSLDEEYDDEFDEGRTKKVRRSRSLPRDSETTSGNKFQSIEDRKKEVQQWSSLLDGYGPGFRRNSGGSGGWSNGGGGGDDSSRDKQRLLPRPGSSNGNSNGARPRHPNSNGNGSSHSNSNNYSRNSHGRSPYRNNHHNGGAGGGGPNHHHRSQSHGSYHHNSSNGNKHWSYDRNRY